MLFLIIIFEKIFTTHFPPAKFMPNGVTFDGPRIKFILFNRHICLANIACTCIWLQFKDMLHERWHVAVRKAKWQKQFTDWMIKKTSGNNKRSATTHTHTHFKLNLNVCGRFSWCSQIVARTNSERNAS